MKTVNHYHENPASFNSSLSLNTSLSCIPNTHPNYYYKKETDPPGFSEKEGYYEIRNKYAREIYTGKFLFGNEHGNSIYKWITDDGTTVYEGFIYCNYIQGYGRFSYPDGSFYEGLYKNNRRYGPGVHAEPNGKQNVGMWKNQKLIKLSVKVDACVPTLSNTHQGREKALKFKKILEVNQRCKDKAKDILTEMDAPLHILKISDSLYNVLTKDTRSQTFNSQPYEEIFKDKIAQIKLKEIVQTLFKPEKRQKMGKLKKKGGKSKWKDIINGGDRKKMSTSALIANATNLISWNNSTEMKEMMQFCFKHVFQENAISYNITDIIKGKRKHFRAPGIHETLCVRFLKKCQIGDHSRVRDYLAFKSINPNVSDSEGNTGLLIASANDQIAVIDVILDHGADINLCNDEGFTPLGLCLTRYLALRNNLEDWEKAFLSNPEETNCPENTLKWRHPGKELESYYRYIDEAADDAVPTEEDLEQGTKEKNENSPLDEQEIKDKIESVRKTILTLIQRGADSALSDVPMPSLIMAIQCRDEELIRSLMETKFNEGPAEQDDPFLQDALYTAIQLPADNVMVSICTTLLKYGADPNAGIENTQEDENEFKLCELSEDEIGKKTVLHKLVTREDGSHFNEYLDAAVKLLLSNGANPEAIFLGHSPLSAAIVKDNVGMIESLMKSQQVNPNQNMAKELGVPLTVLMAPQCFQNLSTTDAISIVDTLVKSGADLLVDVQVGSFTGNIIEFGYKELENLKQESKKGRKADKKGKAHEYQVVLDYITKVAQEGLKNNVKEIVTRSSHLPIPHKSKFSRISDRESSGMRSSMKKREEKKKPILSGVPSWIITDDIVQIINDLQEHEKSLISREQASLILQMTSPDSKHDEQRLERFLSLIKGTSGYYPEGSKLEKKTSRKSGGKTSKTESRKSWSLLEALRRRHLLLGSGPDSLQSRKNNEFITEGKESNVCFGCGHTFNRDLLRLCPVCKLAKFCSPECFWKAQRNNTHKCTGDIFPDWKDKPGNEIDYDQQGNQQGPRSLITKPAKRGRNESIGRKVGEEKMKSADKKRMKNQPINEQIGYQGQFEKELSKEKKRGAEEKSKNNQLHGHLQNGNIPKTKLTKELFKKLPVQKDAGIQDLSSSKFKKEQLQRGDDTKTKDNKFYGDSEINNTTKKSLKNKLFNKKNDIKESLQTDLENETNNIVHKIENNKKGIFEKELTKGNKRGADEKSKINQEYEHSQISNTPKKKLTKTQFKKLPGQEDAEIQDLPKSEFKKEEFGRGDVTKTKYKNLYGSSEINNTTKKPFKNKLIDNKNDINKTLKTHLKKDAKYGDSEHKIENKKERLGKYQKGQGDTGDYKEDKYIEDNIKDNTRRLYPGKGEVRESKSVSRQSNTDIDLNMPTSSQQLTGLYNSEDTVLDDIPYMLKDGSIYYTNDPQNKEILKRENYAFN